MDRGKFTPKFHTEDWPGNLKVAQRNWEKWELEVESGQELAQAWIAALYGRLHHVRKTLVNFKHWRKEGDVVYWRGAKGEPWQVATWWLRALGGHLPAFCAFIL